MERPDKEELPTYSALQKRKWSVQRRQNSKRPQNTPWRIHLVSVKRRSASFVLRGDEWVLHVTRQREHTGRMSDDIGAAYEWTRKRWASSVTNDAVGSANTSPKLLLPGWLLKADRGGLLTSAAQMTAGTFELGITQQHVQAEEMGFWEAL
ncbi:unnamed protein product [Pleuronectes platessa]|uniref:Uncharacterized protein n=1 Tax=Pleuronectes platessa TaxID=8262 RepID=A0A9N7TWY8_PLEPL|nr:unnamed protein product [Pleuronectes platessa]